MTNTFLWVLIGLLQEEHNSRLFPSQYFNKQALLSCTRSKGTKKPEQLLCHASETCINTGFSSDLFWAVWRKIWTQLFILRASKNIKTECLTWFRTESLWGHELDSFQLRGNYLHCCPLKHLIKI